MSSFQSRVLVLTAAVLLAAAQAGAIGTDADTDISNAATVDYTVSGQAQPQVTSNTVTFETDRLITFTVTEAGGYTDVAPGQTARVLTFTVANSSNAPLDFRFTVAQDSTGATEAHGGTDDFDVTAPVVFVDSFPFNGAYDPGVDNVAFLDEVPEDQGRTVFIVADIPLGRANGETAGLTLTGIAAEPGAAGIEGAIVAETTIAEDPDEVDTVFGDLTGDTDADGDGMYSDDDAYRIQTATLVVTKTSRVESDPINGTTLPKRIPGAVIEYCITVQNTGTAPATSVILTDVLTTQPVTYQPGSIFSEDTGGTCAGGTAEDDNAVDPDETDPNGGAVSGGTVSITFTSVPAAATKAGRFRVTIN